MEMAAYDPSQVITLALSLLGLPLLPAAVLSLPASLLGAAFWLVF
jgi:hypothetical protein